jgi:hypothetical protein
MIKKNDKDQKQKNETKQEEVVVLRVKTGMRAGPVCR